MNLDDLKKIGGVVSSAPVPKSVKWVKKEDDGTEQEFEFTIHVLKHSFGSIEQIWNDKDESRSRAASYISKTVRLGEGGKDPISYDDAFQLEPSLAAAFIAAINEVNGTGGSAKN